MARSVVCISRASEPEGEEIGRLVADRLGLLFVDEEIILRAASRGGIDPETVADQERSRSLFARCLEALGEGGAALDAGATPAGWDVPSNEAVRTFIRGAIHEVAERGDAVIVAHAASHAVGDNPKALRVLITASPGTRARRLAAADGLGDEEAGRRVERSDAARADYLKRFYGVGRELPTHYDLVINTDTLSQGEAVALIVAAAADRSAP